MTRAIPALIGLIFAGCGARSALEVAPPAPDGGPPPCEPASPPVERCNGVNDDCDGAIDEGLAFGQLGEERTIRIDEGETGACTSCRWAFGTVLAPTETGYVAVWRIGFDGSRPMPNAFSRALDREGRPVAPVRTLFAEPVPQGFLVTPTTRDRALLSFCIRRGADDVPSSAFLDASGAVIGGAIDRSPRLRGCGGQLVDAVWTGRRHLHTWLHGDEGIALDVSDEEGASIRSEIYDREGWVWIDAGARLSAAHGRVLHVFPHRPDPDSPPTNELIVRTLDLEGAQRSELVVPITMGQIAEPLVAPAPRGWLVLARRNFDTGWYTVRIDDDGSLLSGPTLRETGRTLHNTHFDLEPRPGGGFYFVGTTYTGVPYRYTTMLATLDDEGAIVDAIESPPFDGEESGGWILSPDLAVRDGEVALLFHGLAPERDANRIALRRYGCAE